MDATWSIERGLDGAADRMVVHGDLDIADEERLVRDIDEHFERPAAQDLVVDLGAVDFVDSSAVRAIIRVRRSHGTTSRDRRALAIPCGGCSTSPA